MFFYMPTKIYEEVECVKNHAKELCSLGKHAFIVTGRSSAFFSINKYIFFGFCHYQIRNFNKNQPIVFIKTVLTMMCVPC